MPKQRLIKDRAIIDDTWTLLRPSDDGVFPLVPDKGAVIVPLVLWRHDRAILIRRNAPVGVWLAPDDDPVDIAGDLIRFGVIAVDFPVFSDGRGYTIARLLREHYRYKGELRAVGDVLRDQLFYMHRCGFNAFAVRWDRSLEDALQAFDDFSEAYQISVERPVPLFRRRIA